MSIHVGICLLLLHVFTLCTACMVLIDDIIGYRIQPYKVAQYSVMLFCMCISIHIYIGFRFRLLGLESFEPAALAG